jgi:hypothetical protein
MLKKLVLATMATIAGVAIGASSAMAAASAADAAKLGAELTPLGGLKAGNADGSIPAWDGGLTSAAQAGFANFRPGQHHPDPYANDKPLYTVTPANMSQYASKLTEGHKKLLQTYRNTFKMIVYPRIAVPRPQRIITTQPSELRPPRNSLGGNDQRGDLAIPGRRRSVLEPRWWLSRRRIVARSAKARDRQRRLRW